MDAEPGSDRWELARRGAQGIANASGVDPHQVVVVLGSGWLGALAPILSVCRSSIEVVIGELPGFVRPSVQGHGRIAHSIEMATGRRALILTGRVHAYEGHRDDVVVHAIRSAALAGCTTAILTNAAGAIRPGFGVGDAVLLSDHLNLTGRSPLRGTPPPAPHPSLFVDMVDAYSPRLRALARAIDPSLSEGVYACVNGPQYETPAEVRMLAGMGADLVGMSTVHETIAARHLGLEVLGISLVTNVASGLAAEGIDHADVLAAGAAAAPRLGPLLAGVLARL